VALDTIDHNQTFSYILYIYLVDAVTGSDMTTITSSTVIPDVFLRGSRGVKFGGNERQTLFHELRKQLI
jgi:hypothetical protein